MSIRVYGYVNPRQLQSLAKGFVPRSLVAELTRVLDVKFRGFMKEQFATEGASGGRRWDPLGPGYKKWKDEYFAGKISERREAARQRRNERRSDKKAGKERKRTRVPGMAAENKILQLTGAMKRDFSTIGSGHVAEGFTDGSKKIRIRLGARGPEYYRDHHEGTNGMKVRNQVQHTPTQVSEYRGAAARIMSEHLKRMASALGATWRG